MRPWFILMNNFAHDLFTGLWFGTFITIFALQEKIPPLKASLGDLVTLLFTELNTFFFNMMFFSLVMVALTGMFRFLYYGEDGENGNGSDANHPALKKQLLIVKHTFLGTAFLGGSWLSYLWTH